METALLEEGVTLMLVGMGTVFVFLTLLVGAVLLLSRVAAWLAPAKTSTNVSDEDVAVITAAIIQHRNNNPTR